jgi:hypothetical protein
MPGQDQIVGGMSSNGLPHNVIRGAQQTIEMNHGVDIDAAGEGDDESEKRAPTDRQPTQEWAAELRRADERSHEIRLRCEDLKRANGDLES